VERQRSRVAGVGLAGGHADVDGRSAVSLPSHDAHRPRQVSYWTARSRETALLTCNHHIVRMNLILF